MQEEWGEKLTAFLRQRASIRVFLHLRDARHPGLPIDEEVAAFLQTIRRPDQIVLEVFTKADKLNAKERGALQRDFPGGLFVSVLKKQGIDRLLAAVHDHLFGGSDAPSS